MIKIGTAGAPSTCKSSEEGVKKVKELGLSAMEVEFVRGVRMPTETADQVGETAQKLDVQLSVHAPYYINLNSAEPEKVEASHTRILDSLKIGHHLGARVIVFHAGFYGGDPKTAHAKIKSEIQLLADARNENGWKPLLGPELMGKVSAWGTVDELADVSKIGGVLPVMDFAHYHARHNGGLKSEQDFENLLSSFDVVRGILVASQVRLTHLFCCQRAFIHLLHSNKCCQILRDSMFILAKPERDMPVFAICLEFFKESCCRTPQTQCGSALWQANAKLLPRCRPHGQCSRSSGGRSDRLGLPAALAAVGAAPLPEHSLALRTE